MPQENLRETILENALTLFSAQGFHATTLKQIANAAGCKAPSLYYFFEGGKSEILHEVVTRLFSEASLEIDEIEANSLDEFFKKYGELYEDFVPRWISRTNWLYFEYASLSNEDQKFISTQDAQMHQAITNQLKKFVPEDKVDTLAWITMCAVLGFGHFTYMRDFPVMGGDLVEFNQKLASIFKEWIT